MSERKISKKTATKELFQREEIFHENV